MALRVLAGSFVFGLICVLSTATLPAADAPSDEFVQLIIKLIGNEDKEFRAAGLEQVRTAARGPAFTRQFAALLPKLDPDAQVALVDALADRGDGAARDAILALNSSTKNEKVRVATIGALGQLGTPSDLPLLIKALSADSFAERSAARQSLTRIPGDTIAKTLAAEAKSAPASVKSKLIDVLATRRASHEIPAFVAATLDDDSQVRRAAMAALGQLGRREQIVQMIPGVLKAPKGGERDDAEKNVALVCSRIANEDERGDALVSALNTVPVADRDQLLALVGRVGGKKLLNFVAEVAKSDDSARRQLGIDALSKWPDASAADTLLEIVNTTKNPTERDQAFQGYVKISATRDSRSDKQRLERMKQAMEAAKSPEEKSLVINRTRTAYDVDSMRFVLPYVDQPQFAQIACETIVEIAHHREVRDPNKTEFDKVLDKVIETSKDPVVIDRANRYKRGETWERPRR